MDLPDELCIEILTYVDYLPYVMIDEYKSHLISVSSMHLHLYKTELSKNANALDLLLENPYLIDFQSLQKHNKRVLEVLQIYPDQKDWSSLCCNPHIIPFLIEHIDFIQNVWTCTYNLNYNEGPIEDIFNKFPSLIYWDIYEISGNLHQLDNSIIENNLDRLTKVCLVNPSIVFVKNELFK